MADAGFFKGTSAEQDRRFSDKETKLLRSMKFPPEFDKKVDMRKVNLTVIRPWIAKKIIELVGFEDEVVVEYAMGLLEDESKPTPDPRKMQINLTGFLTKDTPAFMSALWKLLLEAQEDVTGVPRTMVEEKKQEMRKARETDSRAIGERDRRARLDEIRDSDRGRGGGPGRGRGRGGRGRGGREGHDEGRRPRDSGWGGRGGGPGGGPRRRESRSPPRRRSPSVASSRESRSPPRRYRSPPRQRSLPRSSSPTPPPARSRPPMTRARSRSPVRSRSRSRTPILPRRRHRSPSYTPPGRDRDRKYKGRRDSPPRRRRGSPVGRAYSQSSSRSRSPRARGYLRRRSASPPPRRSPGPPRMGRRRSPSTSTISRSPSPKRRSRSGERRPRERSGRGQYGGRGRSPSPSRSRSRSRTSKHRDDRMDVDEERDTKGPHPGGSGVKQELKIRGQAEIERRKSKWDDGPSDEMLDDKDFAELEKRENELKEKALRNKVMRSRKGT